jgi:hypothetical protein
MLLSRNLKELQLKELNNKEFLPKLQLIELPKKKSRDKPKTAIRSIHCTMGSLSNIHQNIMKIDIVFCVQLVS